MDPLQTVRGKSVPVQQAARVYSRAAIREFSMQDNPQTALQFRPARVEDVPDIVRLLAEDQLGAQRETATSPLPDSYFKAFTAIDADPNSELVVCELDQQVVGVLQLTFIPYLTHRGSWRALVEGVRIDKRHRSAGYGTQMFRWVIQRAEQRGCTVLQLTSDKQRRDALRFYQSLGFVASHEGFKRVLHPQASVPG